MISEWAEKLRSDDPDRFAAILAAPALTRERLFTLAAFNLELSRLAWVSENTLIVQMRLQWWHEVVEGKAPPAGPLAEAVSALQLSPSRLSRMILARIQDQDRHPFETSDELWAYLADTSGCLMALGAEALGAEDLDAAENIGAAHGLLNWFRAVPELIARGHEPLPDLSPEAISALAREGLMRFGPVSGTAFAATLPAWEVKALLQSAESSPQAVLEGRLHRSEFLRRTSLLWRAARGRW